MTTPTPQVPLLPSIAPLGANYDAWICDVWGVLHNGVRAFPAAIEACLRFRRTGGSVLLLSNAPRPAAAVRAQLDMLDVPRDICDEILTSGDLTRRWIRDSAHQPLFHLGPARDLGLFKGLDLTLVCEDEAQLVVCSGLLDDTTETPADYASRLRRLAGRGVRMICANPDLTVERGDRLVYCAGALAAEYEQLGGSVVYAGKPHRPIYDMAFARFSQIRGVPLPRDRILAVGDGLRTDIRGAAGAGIDSVFISSGVHVSGELDAIALSRLFGDSGARPVAALPALAW